MRAKFFPTSMNAIRRVTAPHARLLCVLLLFGALAACGGSTSPDEPSPSLSPSPAPSFTSTSTSTAAATSTQPPSTPHVTATTPPVPSATATQTSEAAPQATTPPVRVEHRFAPTADAFVSQNAPSASFGGTDVLEVDGNPRTVSFLHFDIEGLEGTITSAHLRLYAVNASQSGGWIGVLDEEWPEEDITWDNRPSSRGLIVARIGAVAIDSWHEVDITPAVEGDGSVVIVLSSGAENGADYSSRESDTPPELLIETVTGGAPEDPTQADTPLTVVAVGDISCDPEDTGFQDGQGAPTVCRQAHTAAIAEQLDVDAFLALGDLQYPDSALDKFYRSYDRSCGALWDVTYPAPGNHEYMTSGAEGYFDYFGRRAGEPDKGYYAFERAGWLFLALNTNCFDVDCDESSAQYSWLEQTLAAYEGSCQVAYMHHPRWSSSAYGVNDDVLPLFELLYEYGVELALAGHSHSYERFAPQDPFGNLDEANGVSLIVVGTGGVNLREFEDIQPNSLARNSDTFGVLHLTFDTNSWEFKFLPEGKSTFTDSGSGSCR